MKLGDYGGVCEGPFGVILMALPYGGTVGSYAIDEL